MLCKYLGINIIYTTSCTGFYSITIPGFVSTPASVNATLGSTTTFECSVTTGLIGWQVNGSLLSDLNAQNITASQVGRIGFLHIPATEEYNNTVVECIFVIVGGDDLYSDPVILQIQGILCTSGCLLQDY